MDYQSIERGRILINAVWRMYHLLLQLRSDRVLLHQYLILLGVRLGCGRTFP